MKLWKIVLISLLSLGVAEAQQNTPDPGRYAGPLQTQLSAAMGAWLACLAEDNDHKAQIVALQKQIEDLNAQVAKK